MKKISIVTPCFNEELNVDTCYERVAQIFAEELSGYDYEHIFCDNASTDQTEAKLRALADRDQRVKVVLNSRNFGPFHNIFNGLRHASGDAVLVMLAADLQDPPELIPDFVRLWEEGYEVVYGVRKNRKEGMALRQCRKLFYRMTRRMANFEIPLDAGEFQLIDRKVLKAVLQHEDYYPFVRGIIANCGFRSTGVPYELKNRKQGISSNNLYRLIDQAINGLISFTNLPMRLVVFTGFFISIISFLFGFLNIVAQLVMTGRLAAPGSMTIIVIISFIGGVQLFTIGVLGEYISAIHGQVRKRPLVIEKETINLDSPKGAEPLE